MNINKDTCDEFHNSLLTKTSNSNTLDSVFFLYNTFLNCNDVALFNFMMGRQKLLEKIIDKSLSGSFIEFGIMKCSFSFQIMKTLLMNNINKNFYTFDFFEEQITINDSKEESQIKEIYKRTKFKRLTTDELVSYSRKLGFKNLNCIKGNVENTLIPFLNNNNDRFCFVYIDLDVEKPTAFVLKNIWERVVSGGYIIIDDYNSSKWGPFYVIDDFLKDKNCKLSNIHNSIKTGLCIEKL